MKFTLLAIMALFAFGANAQTTIKGNVLDASNHKPMEFVSAILLRLPDSAKIGGQLSNEKGVFTLSNVQNGRYIIKTIMVGYQNGHSAPFEVKGKAIELPAILLNERARTLAEVNITTRLPKIEQRSDRMVLNVEQMNTAGDNALDVLRRAPGVTLDKDENVMYRGSGGVNVMIDGRMTYMSGNDLSNYLKSLPATVLSKIELIANPPASFDAAGTAGVINIKLKRNRIQGTNGTATLSGGYGEYGRAFGGLNLNYNSGKLSAYTRLNGGYSSSFNRLTVNRTIDDELFGQFNLWRPKTQSYGYTVGADLFLSRRHTLGVQYRGSYNPNHTNSSSVTNTFDGSNKLLSQVLMDQPQTGFSNNNAINLNYKFGIDTNGREWSIDFDKVNYASGRDAAIINSFYNQGSAPDLTAIMRSTSPAKTGIYAIKTDYVHPLKKGMRFEAGLKASWVSTDKAPTFDSLTNAGYQPDVRRTNRFIYDEQINAAYASFSATLGKKWDLKIGLRAEQTISTGKSITTGETQKRDYLEFFPSAFVSYKLDNENHFGLNYSRRINRPSYGSLNPFLYYLDPYTAQKGNPFLRPSFSHSMQLNYSHGNFPIVSFDYIKENGVVASVAHQNDQTKEVVNIPENLNSAASFALSITGTINVTKWWDMDNQFRTTYNKVNSPVLDAAYNRSKLAWMASTSQNFSLPKGYKLALFGEYDSPSVNGLYNMLEGYIVSASAKKTFFNKTLTVALKMNDIFNTSKWRSTLRYGNINATWQNEWESRRVSLDLTWKFGSTKLKTARNRKTGASEEENRVSK